MDPWRDTGVGIRGPAVTGAYRLDLVVASLARNQLWLTDAYFIGTSAYVLVLAAAARDGVDVRLLVLGASDIPALAPLSRARYRALLDVSVRAFEWNGTMLHEKTAVADGLWSRVGSTNLNIASWMGNYELDVAIVAGAWPRAIAWPLAVPGRWLSVAWLVKAIAVRRRAPTGGVGALPPNPDGNGSGDAGA